MLNALRIQPGQKCSHPDCVKEADTVARVRDVPGGRLVAYCEPHAEEAVEASNPEYKEWCPNCGCVFGVN